MARAIILNLIFPLLLFITVPVIILAIYGIYQYFYKRRINHALHSKEHSYSPIDPLPFIMLIVLIILTVLSIILIVKVNRLEDELEDQAILSSDISRKLDNLRTGTFIRISDLEDILKQMQQENRLVQDVSYLIDGYHEESEELVDTIISFRLKELNNENRVFLTLINQSDASDKIYVEATSSDLLFTVQVTLDVTKNYNVSIIIDDGTKKVSELLEPFDLKDRMKNRMHISSEANVSMSNNYLEYVVYINNYTGGAESFEIKSAILELYENNQKIKTIDLLKDGYYSGYDTNEIIDYKEARTFDSKKTLTTKVIITDQSGKVFDKQMTLYEVRK